jgi:hypothetical protein
VCEKKNENEDEAENEGPRTNRRGEVLMSSVKMWRRGGEQSKQVKGAEVVWHCLIPLLQTTPPPLQFPRLFRNGPASATRVSTIHVTAEATMAATVDAVTTTTRNTSVFGAKNGDFLTFLVLPSGITFELKLERTSFFHHLHSMHLKNDSKPRINCNNAQFSSKLFSKKT